MLSRNVCSCTSQHRLGRYVLGGQQHLLTTTRRVLSGCHATSADTEHDPSETSTQKPATARRKRVLSGVQPTGTVHLGNYLGAIRNWVDLQDMYDTYFMVVDLHAITLPHNPKELLEATRNGAALYIACGIDPTKAKVFVQSPCLCPRRNGMVVILHHTRRVVEKNDSV
eukprot:jgi/Picre1/32104/NNA_007452.t1